MDRKGWTPLRIAVLIAGIAGTLFSIGGLVEWWMIPDRNRDGLELIGVVLIAVFFGVLVLPTLLLGILGRWLMLGAWLGTAVIVLATDTLWHWLPW